MMQFRAEFFNILEPARFFGTGCYARQSRFRHGDINSFRSARDSAWFEISFLTGPTLRWPDYFFLLG
jgi:hypothetical protein